MICCKITWRVKGECNVQSALLDCVGNRRPVLQVVRSVEVHEQLVLDLGPRVVLVALALLLDSLFAGRLERRSELYLMSRPATLCQPRFPANATTLFSG